MRAIPLLIFAMSAAPAAVPTPQMDGLKNIYVAAVRNVNQAHAQNPGTAKEPDLAKRVPAGSRAALEKLLLMKDSPDLFERLVMCGEAALDLDLMDDFVKVRGRLEKASPAHAARLGVAFSRPRFILRGLDGLDAEYLQGFAEVFEAILESYDQTFGFKEWSKVPGKKLRVRIHVVKQITDRDRPHFAPQFPFHSEIDFSVIDPKALRSPTPQGQFLFFGLCHELGHVIAMWGDPNKKTMDDYHAWADYTGLVIVERLSESAKDRPFMKDLKDVQDPRHSLAAEMKRLGDLQPSLADYEPVLALFFALHEKVGPRAIGDAINYLDLKDKRLRVNRVRYYTFKELKEGFLATLKSSEARKSVASLIPDRPPDRAKK
jgi:hypothetical protein